LATKHLVKANQNLFDVSNHLNQSLDHISAAVPKGNSATATNDHSLAIK
jgi:hypothetical protein